MIFKETDGDNDHRISRAEFIDHMKVKYAIDDRQWDVLFDQLDKNKNGTLCHIEFWARKELRNSSQILDVLDKFNVSTRKIWLTVQKMMHDTDAEQTHVFLTKALSKHPFFKGLND